MLRRIGLVEIDVAGLQQQLAVALHRIAGVDRKVDQRAAELRRIGQRRAQIRRRLDIDLDAGAERRPQQLDGVEHQRVDVDAARLQRLLARERQQAVGEIGGARHRLIDHRGNVPQRRPVGHAVGEHFDAAGDHRENVVEVVRDAAGELADRLHLLRLAQLALGFLERREVAIHDHRAGERAIRVFHAPRACGELHHRVIAVADAEFDVVEALTAPRPRRRTVVIRHRRDAVGEEAFVFPLPAFGADVLGDPEQGHASRIGKHPLALGVEHRHRVRHAGDGLVEQLRLAAQRRIGFVDLGDGFGEGVGKNAALAAQPRRHHQPPGAGKRRDGPGELHDRTGDRTRQQRRQQHRAEHRREADDQARRPERGGGRHDPFQRFGLDHGGADAVRQRRHDDGRCDPLTVGPGEHRRGPRLVAKRSGELREVVLPAPLRFRRDDASVHVVHHVAAVGLDEIHVGVVVQHVTDAFEHGPQIVSDHQHRKHRAAGIAHRRRGCEPRRRRSGGVCPARCPKDPDRREVHLVARQPRGMPERLVITERWQFGVRHGADAAVRSLAIDGDQGAPAIGDADQPIGQKAGLDLHVARIRRRQMRPPLCFSESDLRIGAAVEPRPDDAEMRRQQPGREHFVADDAENRFVSAKPSLGLIGEPRQPGRHGCPPDVVVREHSDRRHRTRHQHGHRQGQAHRQAHRSNLRGKERRTRANYRKRRSGATIVLS